MKDFENRFVGQKLFDVRRLVLTGADLNDVGRTVAGRQLNNTQPIAVRVETHGFGVDRHRPFVGGEAGKVTAV
jgi:hypothetical protein